MLPPCRPSSSSASALESRLEPLIQELSSDATASVSLKTLVDTGQGRLLPKQKQTVEGRNLQVASFLHREMPVRFAHKIADLRSLPHGLADVKSLQTIKSWYVQSLDDVTAQPLPEDEASEARFAKTLQGIYERHSETMVVMSRALFELRQLPGIAKLLAQTKRARASAAALGAVAGKGKGKLRGRNIDTAFADLDDVHTHLDRFFMSRIGIRVLIGQYLSFHNDPVMNALPFRNISSMHDALAMASFDVDGGDGGGGTGGGSLGTTPGGGSQLAGSGSRFIGLICLNTSPAAVAQTAIEDATAVFEREGYDCDTPAVIVQGDTAKTFPYIPSHLYYILFELIKNSMRAVAEKHGDEEDAVTGDAVDMPPIRVIIGHGDENEDVVIKVADEGGGVARSDVKRMFSYLFTTAANPVFQDDDGELDPTTFGQGSVLCGMGYGLPVARAYARYFGGDLNVMSVEGHGVDAYVHLNRLGDGVEPQVY